MTEPAVPDAPTGIAIIGMSGRFPGAPDIDRFWQNLCAGVESISFFADGDPHIAQVDPRLLHDPRYVKARGVLDDVDLFDAAFFGYTPHEAAIIDPQQRLFLECAWAALEHAGYDGATYPGAIGLYAGAALNYYLLTNLYPNREIVGLGGELQAQLGNDKDHLTTRVAYKLNLTGPSITVQTACSTALVAVCSACQSLLAYQCDMALAGGVSLGAPQQAGYLFQESGIGSPDGHCRPFDAQGRGTVGSDGVGLVVLKRLDDALADHDTIHAVITGFGMNNDGMNKAGYTAPSVQGQAQAIAMAHALAGIDPATISYVEAHGTATTLGDPIEIAALTQAFRAGTDRTGFCAIGSVKSNIGHLNTAAGIAGLIKTVLALTHQRIPPSLHFHQPNPQIDFATSPFYVNAQLAAWPAGPTPRRAGVSSFGMGGTNAHVVLEQAPPAPPSPPAPPHQLLLLSARSPSALDQATAALATALATTTAPLADIASTLQCGRRAFPYRRALVGADPATLARQLAHPERLPITHAPATPPPVALLIPGQGAQHPGMTRTLYATAPVFRATVDTCAALLQPHLACDLRTLLYPPPHLAAAAAAQLDQTALTQPAVFTVCYALAQQWLAWGLRPTALLGHSLGEFVAACLAGVFHLPDALALVATRGRLMQTLPPGHMLSVALPAAALPAWLGPDLDLAAVNGPASCVVAGPPAAVAALADRLQAAGVAHRRLASPRAFHSAMMAPIADAFAQAVAGVARQAPQLACVAGVSGTWLTAAEATDPAYWARQLRAPVQFAAGVATLVGAGQAGVLLEVGPGQTLRGLAQGQAGTAVVLASLGHADDAGTPEDAALAAAQGQLWQAGVGLDWAAIQGAGRRRVPLPTYPFARQRFWIAPPAPGAPPGDPLRKKPDPADWGYLPSWRRALPPPVAPAEAHSWLVFADAAGLGTQLIARLRAQGQHVCSVAAGHQWASAGPDAYTIAPDRAEHYQALLAELRTRGVAPSQIVHTWNVTADGGPVADLPAEQAAYTSLLLLAQALGAQPPGRPVRLCIISNAMQSIAGEPLLVPEKALLLGPCQVIPQEYPHISCQSIDVAAPLPAGPAAQLLLGQLLAELAAPPADMIVAYRGRDRWLPGFEAARLAPPAGPAPLREQGVYMITGGLGGMGLALAEHLARTVRARLVLVGRSALPPREHWPQWLADHPDDPAGRKLRAILAIEALGATVLPLSADVADPAQVRAVVAQARTQFGALHGVIHAAGVPGGGMIQLKQPGAAEPALAAKVAGTRALAAALADQPLDFLALCSSLAALAGGFGRADYCAANAFLDAFAHAAPLHTRVFAINWDAWQEAGMAAESALLTDHARAGLGAGLRSAEGAEVFARILAQPGPAQIIVSTRDLAARLAELRRPPQPPATPPADQPPAGQPRTHSAYQAPRTPLEAQIAAVWQRVLGIDPLGVDDNFFELGGHSLLAVQLLSQLQTECGLVVQLPTLFAAPTVAALAAQLAHAAPAAPAAPAISPRGGSPAVAELSFAQQRLWFIDQLAPGISAYNMPVAVRLSGALDVAALEHSLAAITRRHEILRTSIVLEGERPVQLIATAEQATAPTLTRLDLQALPAAARAAEAQRLATLEVQRPFDLAHGPLWRAALLHEAPAEHLLLLTMHHAISDAWSIGVLIRELTALYAGFAAGRPATLAPLPIQYADFAHWQRAWLQGQPLAEQLAYWRAQLAGAPDLELPSDRPRPPVATYHAANLAFALPAELAAALTALSRQAGATLFMTMLAGLYTLLYRYTGQLDIAVSTAVANRGRPELETLIGCLINLLVLRADLAGNPSFRALLARVQQICQGAFAHQDLPFELLVEQLQPRRDLSRNPLAQVMLIVHNAPRDPIELEGLAVRPLALSERLSAEFDLTIHLWEQPDGLHGQATYNTDLFDAGTIARMLEHWQVLLAGLAADPDQRLDALPLLAEHERRLLLETWNTTAAAYPRELRLDQLLAQQAARDPRALAVRAGPAGALSFGELDARANQLAHYLQALGVGPDVPVGVCLARSPELVVALLGVLKAGGAYLPLDPAYPHERLALMLSDAQAPVLLTAGALASGWAAPATLVRLDRDWPAIARHPEAAPANAASPDHLAYLIYTSGSTGRPKGVLITQRGLVNYLSWCVPAYRVAEGQGALVHSSIAFDLTVTSLFAPLLAGRPLMLLPDELGPEALHGALAAAHDLSLVKLTPAHLDLLREWLAPEQAAGRTRAFIIGGEQLPAESLRFWQAHAPGTLLVNEYGPTETVVGCCVYTAQPGAPSAGAVPIGRPIANTRLYVLDPAGRPVPIGVPGELYIGGDGLARGYQGQPALTAERFVPDPFGATPGARLYRSGDRVRYRADGNLEFLGRRDQQIKLRGFRIETGEIEAALLQHPAVAAAAVALHSAPPAGPRLVAYVVAHGRRAAADEPDAEAFGRELRAFLKQRLPEYMLPAAVVALDALPLTPNGKLDRAALPAPADAHPGAAFVAPRTPAEAQLAAIWSAVLGRERVGVHDNFFALGGHSLLAAQMIARARRALNADLTLRALFEAPTVAGLAATLAPAGAADALDDDIPLLARGQRSIDQLLDELEQPPAGPARAGTEEPH
jgi:amino acid adenylation domain-containing protein